MTTDDKVKIQEYREGMDADAIYDAWKAAAEQGLGATWRFADEVFVEMRPRFIRSITKQLAERGRVFTRDDYRNSTRVALDIGRICAIMASAESDGVVTLDVFQVVARLAPLHASCRAVDSGGGAWCETANQ